MSTVPTPPISKKQIVTFLTGLATTAILAVVAFAASNGIHLSAGEVVLITGAVDTGIAGAAGYIVKEETNYLEKALVWLHSIGL